MRWILILGYQQWKSWICLFDLLITLCWLVTNLIPCVLWVTTTTDLLLVGWFIQNPILLTSGELRVTSFRVNWFYRSIGNLTPTLVQNLIFDSMDLLMQISFLVIVDHKRSRCNRLSVPEFDYYTSTFLNKGWFVYLIDLMMHQMWWFSTLWIYLIVCRLHVNKGWVHYDRLFPLTCISRQTRQSLMRKLNTKLIMSAARHPQIDGLIERVDETTQISLHCSLYGLVFWLGTSSIHGLFLLQSFNQWDFDTFEVSYEYPPSN
jgi:hypothetical protein